MTIDRPGADATTLPAGHDRRVGELEAEVRTVTQELAAARDRIEQLRVAVENHSAAEAQQRSELALRTRNLLAVIRSIFVRTSETAETAEEALDHFRGRLD